MTDMPSHPPPLDYTPAPATQLFVFDSPTLTCNNFAPVDEDTLSRCKSHSFTLRMEGELIELVCNDCNHVTRIYE
jgi:hypothetical protein